MFCLILLLLLLVRPMMAARLLPLWLHRCMNPGPRSRQRARTGQPARQPSIHTLAPDSRQASTPHAICASLPPPRRHDSLPRLFRIMNANPGPFRNPYSPGARSIYHGWSCRKVRCREILRPIRESTTLWRSYRYPWPDSLGCDQRRARQDVSSDQPPVS